MSNTFIHLIADYGVGDPAYAEVIQKLKLLDPMVTVNPVNVPKFSTLATGFWIYQLSRVNPFSGMMIYSNTAPRINLGLDQKLTYKGLYGHLTYAELANGVKIAAVNVAYAFSFVKPFIKKFHLINVSNVGTQFRSRDTYPEGVIAIVSGDKNIFGEEVPIDTIPDAPANRVAFIDGYGNLKTSNRVSSNTFKEGTKVKITLNGKVDQAVVGGETYHVKDGELCYAPGSTGGEDRFMEIWVKGKSAYQFFSSPHVESEFKVEEL